MLIGYECDTRFIAAHHQPALLIDVALSRGIDSHRLLRGTGLFYADIAGGHAKLCPEQFVTLIGNAKRLLDADDGSFLFGQRLLPGHYGEASHTLEHACTLFQALERLQRFRALLSPLLTPRLLLDDKQAYLYWSDSCGAAHAQVFLAEACMTAVVAMSRRLSAERLPWRFHFSYAKPRYIEQYWVHLGEDLTFESQMTMMSLPLEWLHRPWPNASATAGQVAEQASQALLASHGWPGSFLDQLYEYLQANIRTPLNLERVAQAFGMSPASLKRKLQKHGTHFQEQLDLVRKHVALYLYQARGYGNDEVAAYLRFTDTTNFRRSFKRWTGVVPSGLRHWHSVAGR
ncbi:AraC family transcriptional regulator ligand-binding domain-containing protein [Stutzerimonas nitrititolerans]|uniref:AraC family transcriptional regulator ligand-binding domain-containing protein n=1 Tax=Stutzerimonas nitrititolerans TaxID=2482751 RepID=UPI0028A66168|nr:AraC family transcriptional regulator ligand-binding domain-containing protein [Stutzerimonas nitrititolerans]